MVKLARAIADGDIKMSVGDLDKMIRLESFLRDGADSRQEIVVADLRSKSPEELREMIREEMETLKEFEAKGCRTPRAVSASARRRRKAATGGNTSPSMGATCMVCGSRCMCIRHTPQRGWAATTSSALPRRRAQMSLTMSAPKSSTACIT